MDVLGYFAGSTLARFLRKTFTSSNSVNQTFYLLPTHSEVGRCTCVVYIICHSVGIQCLAEAAILFCFQYSVLRHLPRDNTRCSFIGLCWFYNGTDHLYTKGVGFPLSR